MHIIGRNAGFNFIELILIVGTLSVVVAAIASLNFNLQKSQVHMASLFHLTLKAKNFAVLITNQNAWTNTLDAAENVQSMRCLRSSSPCTQSGLPDGQPLKNLAFALYDGANQLIYDGTNNGTGYTSAGLPCSKFSAAGSDSCPFRFELRWSAQCTSGNCINPLVKVTAQLSYAPDSTSVRMPLNTTRHSMPEIYRTAQ